MIVTKAIKPKRLQDDRMRLALLSGMKKIGRESVKEYEKTVSTWKQKPKFDYLISLQQPGPTLLVGVSGGGDGADHWRYVNEGTRAHVILPKGNYPLKFQSGYNAKTTPGIISAKAGGPFGDVIYAKGVLHPGTEARNFDEAITKVIEPKFKDEMHKAMRDARQASGHAA